MQEKHVKEKQIEHQKNIIELQEKMKKNLHEVQTLEYFITSILQTVYA